MGIALDSNDWAYVTGYTRSYNFPEGHGGQELTAQGNFGSGYLDGAEDAFVLRLNADGSGLDYCDYLGGWSNERGQDIAVDAGNKGGCPMIGKRATASTRRSTMPGAILMGMD
ncbi:MAG: hypothetical protein KJ077_25535 [Anaerolineae bacterium]|nr:hypothetical protein [Anaerolineae bacterium]